jgi:hypothetical protein
MLARWHTQFLKNGFPIERATLGIFDLVVVHVAGEWQWLIQQNGCDVAEGAMRSGRAAKQQAEAIAARLALPLLPRSEIDQSPATQRAV